MEGKKALIISPHPDDEINLAGQFLSVLKKYKYDIFILFTTNGDAVSKIGNRRIKEAIDACSILGVVEDHVIILGYPNEWKGPTHIYNFEPDRVVESKLGKKETNSIEEHPEYCFQKLGCHHSFTRNHFKTDYKNVILEIMPDVIICPEFDSHPDHRAASLLFDEIIGEILKDIVSYKPCILKKYIHEGVWYGPKDYYSIPPCPTKTNGRRDYSGGSHDLDSPCFRWEDRIKYRADKNTITELLRNNIAYQAAKAHKSTTAWYEMQRVLNADVVYWVRPTNNYVLHANIVVSSGNPAYINDFCLYDSDNICDIEDPFVHSDYFCWKPDLEDAQKQLRIYFSGEKKIKVIRLYEDCNIINHIKRFEIEINQKIVYEGEAVEDGSKTEIILSDFIQTDLVIIRILQWEGKPGISEVEIFPDHLDEVPFPMEKYEFIQDNSCRTEFSQIFEQAVLMTKFLFVFKAKYELKRILGRV